MALLPKMGENFLGARGVATAFAVHPVKNISHGRRSIRREEDVSYTDSEVTVRSRAESLLPVIAGTN
jgi:hypothetical protein